MRCVHPLLAGVIPLVFACTTDQTTTEPTTSADVALATAAAYKVVDLGSLGGEYSEAFGINAAGRVVGRSTLAGEAARHAFLWDRGAMTDLGTLGGLNSQAIAIDSANRVVGSADKASGRTHAFLWQNGLMRDLGTLGGPNSYGQAINNLRQVVGFSETVTGQIHAFLWQNGVMTDLGNLGGGQTFRAAYGINSSSQIVGETVTGQPIRWTNGSTKFLNLPNGGQAAAINASGQIVGYTWNADGYEPVERAFLWVKGTVTLLGTLGGNRSLAGGISPLGAVAGYSETATGRTHAFVWDNGVMTDLGTLGGKLSLAFGINRSGKVVGTSYTTGGEEHAALWKPN